MRVVAGELRGRRIDAPPGKDTRPTTDKVREAVFNTLVHGGRGAGGADDVVTGARVKIGYQAAIMLLRAGCHVIVTTRFPRDAATRYAAEADFDQWRERLEIYGIDLRYSPSVESLCRDLNNRLPRLDAWYARLRERPAYRKAVCIPFDDLKAKLAY